MNAKIALGEKHAKIKVKGNSAGQCCDPPPNSPLPGLVVVPPSGFTHSLPLHSSDLPLNGGTKIRQGERKTVRV